MSNSVLNMSLPNGSVHNLRTDGTEVTLDKDKKTVQESEDGNFFKVESDIEVTLPTGLSDRWSAVFKYEGKDIYGAQDTKRQKQNINKLKGKKSVTDAIEFIVPEDAELREFPRNKLTNINNSALVIHYEDDIWFVGGEINS